MPVDTLQHQMRQPARTAVAPTPPRLRPKGPVGPDFYKQSPTPAERPKQSAVERLEADKAKYVKSQVALSKQQPVRPSEVRKPLVSPGSALRPTRKAPTQTKTKQEGFQLNMEHLSNLINGVSDGAAASSESKGQKKKEAPCPPPRPAWSSPAKVRLKASGPAKVENPGSAGAPAAGTVRRVDVIPQAGPVRTSNRPPLQYMRQPLQPIPLHSQSPLQPATSHLHRFHLRTKTPVTATPPPNLPVFPPPSPAITRLSSSSSRKRPSLTRSKSDMSDRYSRAGTELERFFNLCGLDPADLQDVTGSSSDIVSLARFRSVSAPGSECAGSGRENEEDEDEDAGKAAERAPYNVSVIERNARVIKWLYGLRQAKDSAVKSTNL
ncbi:protein FAM110A [Scomber japonicus]|uniref:protein FAM110A n=1 Tax=Scomber japonicus TaxID=13676 RepID=UPI0023064144|nr:protein FAM110A [Scomber japonicus]